LETSSVAGVHQLLALELERFEREHPRSKELAARARASLLSGVPMPWMVRWAGGFPIFAAEAARGFATSTATNTSTFASGTPRR
jgi:glutamate-1-semialdehyde 2,1-aminomutase